MASTCTLIATICFLGLLLPSAADVQCYTCLWQRGWDYNACDPLDPSMVGSTEVINAPRILNCPEGRLCTVKHRFQRSTQIKWELERGCVVAGHAESTEGCVVDAEYNTCITTCNTDLCNTGNGIPEDDGNAASSVAGSLLTVLLVAVTWRFL